MAYQATTATKLFRSRCISVCDIQHTTAGRYSWGHAVKLHVPHKMATGTIIFSL